MGTLKDLAIVNMPLPPGDVRELHWPKETEWAYILQDKVRFYLVYLGRNTLIEDLEAADLWIAPSVTHHAIQGLEEGTEFLLTFNDGNFSENETFLVTELFGHDPIDVLSRNFGVPKESLEGIPDHEKYIFTLPVPPPIDEVRRGLGSASFTDKYVFRASQTQPIH
ncbi:cupin domain-containing protein [Methylobacterium radiodurans]|uniref:cupin domain-containing protein n=1 Tax=Methylobacterium radiodurans TaxID=2202828 RepID=UPI001FE9666D|nr:cupin domain-containing protein [Methylobacterium radiodurans]